MTDKHENLCSTSIINREMEIKTMWDTSTHFLQLKQDQGLGRIHSNWDFPMCWWGYKSSCSFWKMLWQFLIKFYIYLPYDPATSLQSINPTKKWKYLHRNLYVNAFGRPAHLNYPNWKLPKCPSMAECGSKLVKASIQWVSAQQ